jgi:2-polyprenyl-3-methyl-5-hydroxy-6-metoxy-1,4-benzoquinol methylase
MREIETALESVLTALQRAPGVPALWMQFGALIRYFNLRHPVPPMVRELLARALEHPAVDPGDLVRPISTLALSQPSPLEEPLLLRLMEDVVIRDPALERLITETRRRMLDEALPLPVMLAVAHQCFNTEYIFDETAEERERVDRLRHSLGSLHSYAVYAAYRPLQGANLEGTPLASLARRHVLEPQEERRLAATIPAMAGAQSRVSAAVQAQYEANPYPRWVRMQQGFPGPRAQEVRRILVAGCGTGQHAISTAQRFPRASVLAVDLSLASLAYAKRKTAERNVEYRQADILALAGIEERFDRIECSGVLHHLEDPFEGWRILAGLRKPGGVMRIGLYSELGRRAVVRARELIAAEGFTPDVEGIRACRAAIRARAGDELLARIVRNEDFYSMSGLRDLLFHVQEQRFSLPQIKAMLERLGLKVVELEFPDSGESLARYRARFPRDPEALDLDNWHRIEQEFPDTFARMYQFSVC